MVEQFSIRKRNKMVLQKGAKREGNRTRDHSAFNEI